jgi:hypothetical protein
MKVSSLVVFASFLFARFSPAADATSPVDYTLRNDSFAPSASFPIDRRAPLRNGSIQEKRVSPETLDKKIAPVSAGDRAAGIEMTEAREKTIQPLEAQRPESRERTLNAMNQRPASIATSATAPKPAVVAKYQDSLTAASASNMARFPALDGATTAKINRFVFRKNAAEPAAAPDAPVTPAAGGSPVRK